VPAPIGLVGDLLGGDLVDAALGEELTGGCGDAVELLLLVPLARPGDLEARGMAAALRC
jgi:hypothetical protein